MTHLIDKSALVAEIERIKHETNYEPFTGEVLGKRYACGSLLSFLDALEVKEVDLDAELNKWRHNHFHGRRDKDASGEYLERISQLELAKHFFELGVNASNPLTWEDIADILDVTDVIANDDSMEERLKTMSEEEYCQEVLKRFKERKGE